MYVLNAATFCCAVPWLGWAGGCVGTEGESAVVASNRHLPAIFDWIDMNLPFELPAQCQNLVYERENTSDKNRGPLRWHSKINLSKGPVVETCAHQRLQ